MDGNKLFAIQVGSNFKFKILRGVRGETHSLKGFTPSVDVYVVDGWFSYDKPFVKQCTSDWLASGNKRLKMTC